MERFFSKIKFDENTTCWIFLGGKTPTGYGCFYYNGRLGGAHRFSYELFKGKIPKGLQIDHLCKNTSCVNPEHLEAVTSHENSMRSNSFASIESKLTHCPKGHPYSGENLYEWEGNRQCKTCRKEYRDKNGKKYWLKNREAKILYLREYRKLKPEQRWARDLLRAEGVIC